MSRDTFYRCDVCKKRLFSGYSYGFFRVTQPYKVFQISIPLWGRSRVDMCTPCWAKFDEWVNKEESE